MGTLCDKRVVRVMRRPRQSLRNCQVSRFDPICSIRVQKGGFVRTIGLLLYNVDIILNWRNWS